MKPLKIYIDFLRIMIQETTIKSTACWNLSVPCIYFHKFLAYPSEVIAISNLINHFAKWSMVALELQIKLAINCHRFGWLIIYLFQVLSHTSVQHAARASREKCCWSNTSASIRVRGRTLVLSVERPLLIARIWVYMPDYIQVSSNKFG